MIAGLMLSDEEDLASELAFLGDELKVFSLETNQEIVDKIVEFEPGVLAVNSAGKVTREELSDEEENLKEEGFNFTPSRTESRKVKRFQGLKTLIKREMLEAPEFIRFDPHITAEELAIEGDKALDAYGVDTSDINSARQFDAVLGSITARFYQQKQFQDLGVIVPKNLESDESDDEE